MPSEPCSWLILPNIDEHSQFFADISCVKKSSPVRAWLPLGYPQPSSELHTLQILFPSLGHVLAITRLTSFCSTEDHCNPLLPEKGSHTWCYFWCYFWFLLTMANMDPADFWVLDLHSSVYFLLSSNLEVLRYIFLVFRGNLGLCLLYSFLSSLLLIHTLLTPTFLLWVMLLFLPQVLASFPLWGTVLSLTFTEAFRGHTSKARFSASVITPHFNFLCGCKVLNLQSWLEFQMSSQNSRQKRFPHCRTRCQTTFRTFKRCRPTGFSSSQLHIKLSLNSELAES